MTQQYAFEIFEDDGAKVAATPSWLNFCDEHELKTWDEDHLKISELFTGSFIEHRQSIIFSDKNQLTLFLLK